MFSLVAILLIDTPMFSRESPGADPKDVAEGEVKDVDAPPATTPIFTEIHLYQGAMPVATEKLPVGTIFNVLRALLSL